MPASPVVPEPKHGVETKYVSRHLIQYVPDKSKSDCLLQENMHLVATRMLTSDKCAQILKERDEKKQKELEEKVMGKAERQQKKKEREEDAREKKKKQPERKQQTQLT